jgi:hypothetical protein
MLCILDVACGRSAEANLPTTTSGLGPPFRRCGRTTQSQDSVVGGHRVAKSASFGPIDLLDNTKPGISHEEARWAETDDLGKRRPPRWRAVLDVNLTRLLSWC